MKKIFLGCFELDTNVCSKVPVVEESVVKIEAPGLEHTCLSSHDPASFYPVQDVLQHHQRRSSSRDPVHRPCPGRGPRLALSTSQSVVSDTGLS